MAFILLCQKRDKLLICHQPMLLPKLPFTIGKLFTILESLPLCNSPAYSGWESSCRLFAISAGLDFVIFVAYIIEYVTTDCQVFTFYPFMILIQCMRRNIYGTIGSLSNRSSLVLPFVKRVGCRSQTLIAHYLSTTCNCMSHTLPFNSRSHPPVFSITNCIVK